MKRAMTLGALIIGLMAFTTTIKAQDKVEATISADIVSKYVWRGFELGAQSVQPSAGVSYKGLSLSAWGSYGLTNSEEQELDLTLAYSTGGLTVGVTDYYCIPNAKYFLYNAHETAHVFEANIAYDFGPVALSWNTNFAGADYFKADGKRSYSTYVEATAPFTLGGLDWTATIGAVPFKANETSYLANSSGFAVTNAALTVSKDLKVTDSFSLPLFATLAANPSTQKAYFVFGVTLKP